MIDTAELRRKYELSMRRSYPQQSVPAVKIWNALPALLDEVERLRGGCEDCDIARRDFAHSQDLDYVKWAAERERLTAENAALLARAEAAEAKVAEAREVARDTLDTNYYGSCYQFDDEMYDRLRALAGKEGE